MAFLPPESADREDRAQYTHTRWNDVHFVDFSQDNILNTPSYLPVALQDSNMPRKEIYSGPITAQVQQNILSEGIENYELPKSVVMKIAKSAVPDNVKLQKETVLSLVKGSTVFINYLGTRSPQKCKISIHPLHSCNPYHARSAHDVAISKQHKSISASDVLKALETIEFSDMVHMLQDELQVYRELNKNDKGKGNSNGASASSRKGNGGASSASAPSKGGKGKEKANTSASAGNPLPPPFTSTPLPARHPRVAELSGTGDTPMEVDDDEEQSVSTAGGFAPEHGEDGEDQEEVAEDDAEEEIIETDDDQLEEQQELEDLDAVEEAELRTMSMGVEESVCIKVNSASPLTITYKIHIPLYTLQYPSKMPRPIIYTGTITAQVQQNILSEGLENFELPKSVVMKIAKSAIPDNVKLQKETVLSLVQGSSVFVNHLVATAHDVAVSKQHKSISASDVLKALETIEFGDMVQTLQDDLQGKPSPLYRELNKTDKGKGSSNGASASSRKGNGGASSASAPPKGGKGKEKAHTSASTGNPLPPPFTSTPLDTQARHPRVAQLSGRGTADSPMEIDDDEEQSVSAAGSRARGRKEHVEEADEEDENMETDEERPELKRVLEVLDVLGGDKCLWD
ncbi:hypothetical protein CVT26_012724 [Gymnopilus dilepis]|uniref:DNA polymerase epsilon subunit D n=1 Tax=Gymnopilus dilepis TaxID=231916 RepID=A0A409YPF1_9AGAR|nr:hypothetical protein CVT26_012724 [Gymnopilus dilepis]